MDSKDGKHAPWEAEGDRQQIRMHAEFLAVPLGRAFGILIDELDSSAGLLSATGLLFLCCVDCTFLPGDWTVIPCDG